MSTETKVIPFPASTEWGERYQSEWLDLIRSGRKTLIVLPVDPQPNEYMLGRFDVEGLYGVRGGDESEAVSSMIFECPYPVGSVLVVDAIQFRVGFEPLRLTVQSVECRRVNEITEDEARDAGAKESSVLPGDRGSFVPWFSYLWYEDHGEKYPFETAWAWLIGVEVTDDNK